LQELKDSRARAVIRARLARVGAGNLGDCKPLRDGVQEENWFSMNAPRDKIYDGSIVDELSDLDEAAAYPDAVAVTTKQDIFERLIGEAYQVIAALATDCGRFDDPHVINALDNLVALRIVHDDVLPFPSKGAPG
jgi:hypothetical protein